MPRYKITLEYDGGGFNGWQRQENGTGVQQVIEEAIAAFAGAPTTLYGAGRTDAGVHATGQVAHFDLEREAEPDTVRDALNFHARPHPVAVLEAARVADDFDARFSAVARIYRYRILNRRAPAPLLAGRVWRVAVPLDADAMSDAAARLPGKHDFSTFRAANCQADSPLKTLDALTVRRAGDEIVIEARARSFLYNQVRIMVGTLRQVGEGKRTAGDVAEALAARDRERGGPTAPPEGLYLTRVLY